MWTCCIWMNDIGELFKMHLWRCVSFHVSGLTFYAGYGMVICRRYDRFRSVLVDLHICTHMLYCLCMFFV